MISTALNYSKRKILIFQMIVCGIGAFSNVAARANVLVSCLACHSINGENKIGPTLKNVIGRKAGTVPGFRYSRAMRNSGIIWNKENLDKFIKNPQAVVPGDRMPFPGIRNKKQREVIMLFLEQSSKK